MRREAGLSGRQRMNERRRVDKPKPWAEYSEELNSRRLKSFHRFEWCLSWVAWALGNWVLLDVLEHLGTFSVLVAVIFYFAGSGNRLKQKHYQAWQVINTAQGKGGSGGRVEALQELNADHISLVGIEASGAFLQGVNLPNGNLSRCDFHASDLRNSRFVNAAMTFCNLRDANFRGADLSGARLEDADLENVDLNGATLRGTVLSRVTLTAVDLRNTDLQGLGWNDVVSFKQANVWGVRNAPPGFIKAAMEQGAVSMESDDQWNALLKAADK